MQALFKLEPPEPAEAQKESFGELLSQSLEDACSLPLVQKVHEQLRQNIEAHKELKSDEPLVVQPAGGLGRAFYLRRGGSEAGKIQRRV